MYKKYFLILMVLLTSRSIYAQNYSVKASAKRMSAIFEEAKPKPQVLLLGVFHFAGEQVDANTTPPGLQLNMLNAARQKQIEALVKKLAAFKPTKIVIEASPRSQRYCDSLYYE